MRGTSRLFGTAAAIVAALTLAACGEEDFKNDPRPASPIELSARIGDDEVDVSPNDANEVGGGLVTITISNQSADASKLVLSGPTDASSPEIGPGSVGSLKTNLKQGDYTVTAPGTGARSGKLAVGANRPTSQNDLLQP
jgi:hypothetical protein